MYQRCLAAFVLWVFLCPFIPPAHAGVDYYESRLKEARIFQIHLGMDLDKAREIYSLELLNSYGKEARRSIYRIRDEIPGTAKYRIVTYVEGPIEFRKGKLANERSQEKIELYQDRFKVTIDDETKRIVAMECHFSADRGKAVSEDIRKHYVSLLGNPDKIISSEGGVYQELHWIRDGYLIRIDHRDDQPLYGIAIENAVTGIEIVGHGLFEKAAGEKEYNLTHATTRVPMKIGTALGISYKIRTHVPGVREQVDLDLKTPVMTDPKTGRTSSGISTFRYPVSGQVSHIIFLIQNDYQRVAGPFTFRISKRYTRVDLKAVAEWVLEVIPPEQ